MKKFLRLLLLLGVVLGLASGAGAEYYDEGHSGIEADPYVIDTNADLVTLRDRVNAGTEPGDMYYKLTQNLNISQYTDWNPIGTDDYPSTGHFDGNSWSIHINISGSLNGRYTAGAANILNSGSIENCSFSGTLESSASYASYAGGIVQKMTDGTIKNCTMSGSVKSSTSYWIAGSTFYYEPAYSGGIVADMSGGSIEHCKAEGVEVYAIQRSRPDSKPSYAGGIVAYANISVSFGGINDCTFSGNVNSYYSGGIVGYVSGGNLQNNHITGNTNGQASITSNYASGGIAGRIGDSTVLESCDVSSIVIVSGDTTAEGIGGIVGIMNASTVRNNQSYASPFGVVGKLDAASYTLTNHHQ